MKPYQFIGWTLINATAVTAICTSNSIFHGMRPSASALSTLPSINYFELSGRRFNGTESIAFSINCRAVTASTAIDLARVVDEVFHGTAGTGMTGTNNSFDVGRSSLIQNQGLIPEPDNSGYNAPVDVRIVFASSTVS
jgi:hypothetical protein